MEDKHQHQPMSYGEDFICSVYDCRKPIVEVTPPEWECSCGSRETKTGYYGGILCVKDKGEKFKHKIKKVKSGVWELKK